jgi:alanine dehydrogenase
VTTLPIIHEADVRALLDRQEAVGIVESAYRAAAEGQADVSHPSALHLRGDVKSGTTFKIKGAALASLEVAGFRIVTDIASGDASDFLYIVDFATGTPLGLVSEMWLHRVRTATTGLVACRALLAENPRSLALIGTGRIAEEFLRSYDLFFPPARITLASRSPARARIAADRWQPLTHSELVAADSVPSALAEADVVVTLTDASESLFSASDLRPGMLLCAMGGQYEFDADVLSWADQFIVDEIDFVCTAGSGAHWLASGQITRAELEARVSTSIGEVLLDRKQAFFGRNILAIIQGMAICDLALAKAVLDRLPAPS